MISDPLVRLSENMKQKGGYYHECKNLKRSVYPEYALAG